MQDFGTYTIKNGVPIQVQTGCAWQYVTIANNSPYILNLNFIGLNGCPLSPWTEQDFQISQQYMGSVIITPYNPLNIVQTTNQGVQVKAWAKGELSAPGRTALTQISGGLVTSLVGQQLQLTGTISGAGTFNMIPINATDTLYLKSFTLSGPKVASNVSGVFEIYVILSGTLQYTINQTTTGFTTLQDKFDPPVPSGQGQDITFSFPAGFTSLTLQAQGVSVPQA